MSSVFCFVSFLLLFFYVTVMEVAPKRNKGRPDGYVNTSFSGSLPQFSLCFVCITMNFGNKYDDVNVITCITFCRLFDEGVGPTSPAVAYNYPTTATTTAMVHSSKRPNERLV